VHQGKLLALAVSAERIKNGRQPFLNFNFAARLFGWGCAFVFGLILLSQTCAL